MLRPARRTPAPTSRSRCIEVPRAEATGFGVMHVDATDRIVAFVEKPAGPAGDAGPARTRRSRAWASTSSGAKFLFEQLRRDAADPDVEPRLRQGHHSRSMVQQRQGGRAPLHASPACGRAPKANAYWRDVGTLDAYWEANIDLTDVVPALDLYDRDWPIWTYAEITPPAKFVHDDDGRRGAAIASLVSGGCIVSGASLRSSLLFTGVRVHSTATSRTRSILPDVDIGRRGAARATSIIDAA